MESRPNIILILADDMGIADLGCMGSEIRTPNLDSLARNGALMSTMYNCARCCPTRASLLTGLYPHKAGIGHMGTNLGTAAYQGFLRDDAATMAEHLSAAGYRTLMSGKWHVGGDYPSLDMPNWAPGSPGHPTPRQRGFDRFYGILDGATHFFSPHYLVEDDTRSIDIADDFYFTDAITDKAIGLIDEDQTRPFFLYLAHTAPHWPLHAPAQDIARYDGCYDRGWDVIRTRRHEQMNDSGVLRSTWDISARDPDVPPWEAIEHKDWEASKMATYAAMVDRMDQSIGRLVTALKDRDMFDNTLILFLSDNGGCAEFMAEDGWAQFYPDKTHDGRQIAMGNSPDIRPGDPLTIQSYDKPWANVSNAPFRLFKHFVHEGAISTPLIAHWPARIQPTVSHEPAHVADILPTLLEAAGAAPLAEIKDKPAQDIDGESFLDLLLGTDWSREQPIFFEHEGNAAVRMGTFKLVRQFGQPWELYDIDADRTELNNLIGTHQRFERDLRAQYSDWAAKSGVMDWDIGLPRLLTAWGLDSVNG